MKPLRLLLLASTLTLSGSVLVIGCGSSSGPMMNPDGGGGAAGHPNDGGKDVVQHDSPTDHNMGTDSPTDTAGGPCFPALVLKVLGTSPNSAPLAIPNPCADNPPGAAQNAEFKSVFP